MAFNVGDEDWYKKRRCCSSQALSFKPYVVQMFDCGLFESRSHPWMAASPDALAVNTVGDDVYH
jgi:hypothetical protein